MNPELKEMFDAAPTAAAPNRDPSAREGDGSLLNTAVGVARDMTLDSPPIEMLETFFGGGEKGVSPAKSLATGVADTATWGSAGPMAAGYNRFPQLPVPIKAALGYGNASANTLGLPTFKNTDAASQQVEDTMAANPKAALTGQVGGAFLGGTPAAQVGKAILKKGAQEAGEIGQRVLSGLANRWYGRAATGAVAGGAEGGLYAHNKGDNVAMGVLTGTAAGGAGSAAVDAISAGLRQYVTGSASKTEALAELLGGKRQEAGPGNDPIQRQEIEQKMNALGPKATLMDADPAIQDQTLGAALNPELYASMRPVHKAMEARIGDKPGSLGDDFEKGVNAMVPTEFKREAGDISGPRSAGDVNLNAKNYSKTLQPEFSKILEGSNFAIHPDKVSSGVQRAMFDKKALAGQRKPGRGEQKAWAKLDNHIQELTADRLVSKKGGKRGEKVPIAREWDATTLHNLRKAIDADIDKSFKPNGTALDSEELRALVVARNQVDTMLNKVKGFEGINRKYATEASYKRSYALGQNLLKNNKDSMSDEVLDDFMVSANPGDIQGFWEGIAYSIIDDMKVPNGELRQAKKIVKDDRIGVKLRTAFGEDIGNDVINLANQTLELGTTSSALLGNSETAKRIARSGQRNTDTAKLIDRFIMLGAGANILSRGKHGTSITAGATTARRAATGDIDPAVAAEYPGIALAQGDEAMAILDQMKQLDDTFQLPTALGGVDKALAAQRGDIPHSLSTLDMGQAIPYSMGIMAPAIDSNSQGNQMRRRSKRQRRSNAQ